MIVIIAAFTVGSKPNICKSDCMEETTGSEPYISSNDALLGHHKDEANEDG